jgi:hypothetical protein
MDANPVDLMTKCLLPCKFANLPFGLCNPQNRWQSHPCTESWLSMLNELVIHECGQVHVPPQAEVVPFEEQCCPVPTSLEICNVCISCHLQCPCLMKLLVTFSFSRQRHIILSAKRSSMSSNSGF